MALAARRAVLPRAARASRGARLQRPHAPAARSRPDRALQRVPAPEAQDASVRGAGGRALPDAAHPHPRGHPDRAVLPGGPIEVLGPTGPKRIDTLVHDMVAASEAAGDIVQGAEVGEAMDALRTFMFDEVYLGPVAQSEHGKIHTMIQALFAHY